ncbi:MAG: ATP-binding cassette domain-containing protein [Bacteroidaceae bacterium]|nr:ATP-binding cassette domain-containing protein [Bacteroidaceae bacterium]
MRTIIRISEGNSSRPEFRFRAPINIEFNEGEQIAIVGSNGSGKSILVDTLTGANPMRGVRPQYDFGPGRSPLAYDNIKHIAFRDSYGYADRTYYYQLRWNQHDIDEETPTVGTLLEAAYQKAGDDSPERRAMRERLYRMFHLDQLLDKYIILLSSGELRKFQITKMLLTNPRVLIMENPFIGLDVDARQQLRDLLTDLIGNTDTMVILVLSKIDDIPGCMTHVVEVSNMEVGKKMTFDEYKALMPKRPAHVLSDEKRNEILGLPHNDNDYNSDEIIDFRNVCIRYGSRTILKDLNWKVRNGERWALSGENGAGKSTLLSLVCADNPQSYACDISLFGQKRGTGESIWEIKKHIGYVSPEMHRSFMKDIPVIEIVANGFSDKQGLYTKARRDNLDACRFWMRMFGIDHLERQTFLKLSSGEQRLCLLARAFVKDPELLILDEPLHGLDLTNRQLVKDIIETFCQRRNKTLIMVTHYKDELPSVITHSIFLKKNR